MVPIWLLAACAVSSEPASGGGVTTDASDASSDVAQPSADAASSTGGDAIAPAGGSLGDNRDRLLSTYFAYLKASATTPQSNGLSSSNVASVCDVWTKLDPSSQSVFLTLTARLQGSVIAVDNGAMLSHVTKVYRIVGGQNATASDPGSCGGGESNRMIMSMDAMLHDAQLAASTHKGARQSSGKYDIADAPTGTFWRNSNDIGGPHSPFDLSDETDQGAPRGQTQYFADPTSALAKGALGRQDLATLIDPYALEMDQDYDCIHNSNPICAYTTYGPLCAPETSELGTKVYTDSYGSFDATWKPSGCP
jgi:hypothetical protein